MNGPYNRRKRRLLAEINIVPYIDVMLVLLVIFMVTTPLLNQGVEIDLPQADTKALPSSAITTLVLAINADGDYFLHFAGQTGEPLSPEAVALRTAAVLQRQPSTPIAVRADRSVRYDQIVQAMALLQRAGASKIGLATRLPQLPR